MGEISVWIYEILCVLRRKRCLWAGLIRETSLEKVGLCEFCVNCEEQGQWYKIEWNHEQRWWDCKMHVVLEEQKGRWPDNNPSIHVMPLWMEVLPTCEVVVQMLCMHHTERQTSDPPLCPDSLAQMAALTCTSHVQTARMSVETSVWLSGLLFLDNLERNWSSLNYIKCFSKQAHLSEGQCTVSKLTTNLFSIVSHHLWYPPTLPT